MRSGEARCRYAPSVMEVVTRATFTLYTFSKYSRISDLVCLGLCELRKGEGPGGGEELNG